MYLSREDVVTEFHNKFNHSINVDTDDDLIVLRNKLVFEEYEELKDELAAAITDIQLEGKISNKTKARIAKELADLQYVISGMAVALGIPLQVAFVRVHKSNLSKLGEDGKPIYRADGKVLKGPNYAPPDMESLFDEAN